MENEAVSMTSKLIDYGVLGIFCVFLIGALAYLHRAHERERREWRDTIKTQFEISNVLSQKVIDVTAEMKGIIQSLRLWSGKGP